MQQPGVETRPIALIAGDSPFCETFFTDATAAKDDLLGELNGGWSVGKRLLQHERASQTGARRWAARQAPLQDIARRYVEIDGDGRIADRDLRARLTRHLMDARAHGLTLGRAMAEARGNADPGNAASVLKNSATRVAQTRAELTLEIMGAPGPRLGGRGLRARRDRGGARLAVRQGDVDLRRLGRDPEQHRRQAHPGPAGDHPAGVRPRQPRTAALRSAWPLTGRHP